MRALFDGDDSVKIPRVHRALSTARVMTMDLVSGIKVDDEERLLAEGFDPGEVMQNVMRVFVRMIMGAGFFHADPHPGNLLIRRGDDGEAQLGYRHGGQPLASAAPANGPCFERGGRDHECSETGLSRVSGLGRCRVAVVRDEPAGRDGEPG